MNVDVNSLLALGNEGSDASFYAAAAMLFDVPPKSARQRVAGDER